MIRNELLMSMVDTLAVAHSRNSRNVFVCRKYDDFTAAASGLRVHYTGEKYRKLIIGKVVRRLDRPTGSPAITPLQ